MHRPDLRIRVQLTVSVCLFTVVCVISLAVAIYALSRNTLLNIQIGNLDLNSRMLQEECRQEFEDIFETFYRLSYSTPMQKIYENYTDSDTILSAANVLHDSFGPDRILLLKLYLLNGTEVLEVDSRSVSGSSSIPQSLLPVSNPAVSLNSTLKTVNDQYGLFMGPAKSGNMITGVPYVLSLTLPIRNDSMYSQSASTSSSYKNQNLLSRRSIRDTVQNTSTTQVAGIMGYATFVVNCLKLARTLSSISQGSTANEIGAAALCVEKNNFTEFQQLIPFNENTSTLAENSTYYYDELESTPSMLNWFSIYEKKSTHSSDNFPIAASLGDKLRQGLLPRSGVNKGPNKSMISVSPFTVLYSTYYVVVLQSHKGVFHMLHSLRRIIIITSSVIGAGMIIFTFLFVSFGARQILRLKLAATYEQPANTRWKIFTIPWWLRSSNRKKREELDERIEFQVPERVPLRKHVRDELDDITERFNTMSNELRKQYELLEDRVEARKAEIEQAREAADIANAAKSHFLARVTHELRTPLNGIIGTATLCLQEDNIQQIHHSLRTIFKCGELLLHLMTDLLSFSQNEVENLNLEMRDFTLPEITSQLKAIFTEQCVTKKIKLSVDSCEQYKNLIFSGDTNRISQVIFNLMSNGIKFTPEGGEVYFHAEVIDNEGPQMVKTLKFYVRDNGPGIAPEMQARVFEAFVQGDISKQVKKAGVGLGLSICRQLAERMNGTIVLKSDLGRGSTFIFELPLSFKVADADSSISSLMDSSSVSSRLLGSSPSRWNHSNGHGTAELSPSTSEHYHSSSSTPKNSPGPDMQPGDHTPNGSGNPGAGSKRSVFTRTFSSTSQIRGLLASSRRRTQESIFRTKDISKQAAEDIQHADDLAGSEPDTPKSSVGPSTPSSKPAQHFSKTDITSSDNHDQKMKRPGGSRSLKSFVDKPKFMRSSSSPTTVEQSSEPPNSHRIHHQTPDNHQLGDIATSGNKALTPSVSNLEAKISTPIELKAPEQFNNNSTDYSHIQMPPKPDTSKFNLVPDAHNLSAAPEIPRPTIQSKKSFVDRITVDIKVLVVDDNSVNQEVMVRMLNLEGLKSIKVANDGLDAIEKVKQALEENNGFDVIFMDVQMPNMDGRQATRVIRNELNLSVPIVAVSAFANEKNADDCLEAGMNLFLSKPLRRPHLRQILRNLISSDGEKNVDSNT